MSTDKLLKPLRLPSQTDPPRSPRETLPTMYDLPSEAPKEPSLIASPSYHAKRRCDMTRFIQRIVISLAVLAYLGLRNSFPCTAEISQVGSATKQVESGARQVGRGVEDTAKGVGNTVVEGAKVAGEKIQEAGKTAQPQVEDTLYKVKDGAEAAGTSVKNFVNKLFGK
jgi:hypothetical protein